MVYGSWFKGDLPFDCNDCNDPLRGTRGRVTAQDRTRIIMQRKCSRGCVAKLKQPAYAVPFSNDDGNKIEKWSWCPRLFEKTYIREWIGSYEFFEQTGAMPCSGGLDDQPAKWVEAMMVISTEMAKCKKEHFDRNEKEVQRKIKK